MISHMSPRQFKKLCKKSFAEVLRIEPSMARIAFAPKDRDETDATWHHTTLKGTKGFGDVSGYYEPDWWDDSAWAVLVDLVYWHFAVFDPNKPECPYPEWPSHLEPRTWRDYFSLSRQMPAGQVNTMAIGDWAGLRYRA